MATVAVLRRVIWKFLKRHRCKEHTLSALCCVLAVCELRVCLCVLGQCCFCVLL